MVPGSRRTHHRGDLLICASSRRSSPPRYDLLVGVALCIVSVLDCRPMTQSDEIAACVPLRQGHYAWVLGYPRSVPYQRVCG